MAWIKRNLFFLIGSVIALALLVAAGLYLLTRNKLNNELSAQLDEQYTALNLLNAQSPNAGNARVDNIKTAHEQRKQLQEFIERSGKFFTPVPAILPDPDTITDQEFASALSQTIDQLQHAAAVNSVTLPPHYDFSFSGIKSKITFAADSLPLLAAQLSEVKAIGDILFSAKINSLASIRRERVSSDDKEMADYTSLQSITNDVAVVTPYEITIHCFSTELAGVLGGFVSSPYGFIVRSMDVGATPIKTPMMANPPPGVPPSAFAPVNQPTSILPVGHGGLPSVLNEQPLKINLVVALVKLKAVPK